MVPMVAAAKQALVTDIMTKGQSKSPRTPLLAVDAAQDRIAATNVRYSVHTRQER